MRENRKRRGVFGLAPVTADLDAALKADDAEARKRRILAVGRRIDSECVGTQIAHNIISDYRDVRDLRKSPQRQRSVFADDGQFPQSGQGG